MNPCTPDDFQPLKPLQQYLQGLELLETLEGLRLRLEERRDSFEFEGVAGSARFEEAMGLIQRRRERLEHWMALCEQRLDEGLQRQANQAEAGQALFERVAQLMADFNREAQASQSSGAPGAALSPEARRQWDVLRWDFERIREAWRDRLPPFSEGTAAWES